MVDREGLRESFRADRVSWGRHAQERMSERGISRDDVRCLVECGEVIEEYAEGSFYPACLLLGFPGGRALHAVVAWNQEDRTVYVVAVYEPDNEHFEADRKTRKGRRDG